MAHKSHRQKALQAQLEAPAAITLVTAPPAKASSSKLRASMPAHATTTMDVDSDEEENDRDEDDSDDDEDDDDAMHTETQHFAPAGSSASGPSAAAASGSSSGFAPLSAAAQSAPVLKNEFRRIPIPPHRMTPLTREWVHIYTPLAEELKLQVRMNVKRRAVELRVSSWDPDMTCNQSRRAGGSATDTVQTSEHTIDSGAVQKGADFVKAFALGFEVKASLSTHRIGFSADHVGRRCVDEIRRHVPRLVRDQGRQDSAWQPSCASNR